MYYASKFKHGSSRNQTNKKKYGTKKSYDIKQKYMVNSPNFDNSYHLPSPSFQSSSSSSNNASKYIQNDMFGDRSKTPTYASNIGSSQRKKRKKRQTSRSKTNTPYNMYKKAIKKWIPGSSLFKQSTKNGPTQTTRVQAFTSQSFYEPTNQETNTSYSSKMNVTTNGVLSYHKKYGTSKKTKYSSSGKRPTSTMRNRLFSPLSTPKSSSRPKRSRRRKKKVAPTSKTPSATQQNFFREHQPPKSTTPSSRMFGLNNPSFLNSNQSKTITTSSNRPKKIPKSKQQQQKYHVYDDSLYYDHEVKSINTSHHTSSSNHRPQTTMDHYQTTPKKKEPKVSSNVKESPITKQPQPSIMPQRRRSSVVVEEKIESTLQRLQNYKFGTQDNSYRNYNDVDLRIDVIMYKFFIQSTMKRYFQYDLLDKFLEQVPNLDRKACRLDLDGISRSLRKLAHQHS